MKGTPLRIEVGEKEMENREFLLARRCDGLKQKFALKDCKEVILEQISEIKKIMYEKAKKRLDQNIEQVEDWKGFMESLNKLKIVNTFWCDNT